MRWFLWWEVCCVNIALTIHQKYTLKFLLFTERSRLFLQPTEKSHCYGKISILLLLPGLGPFSRGSVLSQDIFLDFGVPLVHSCNWARIPVLLPRNRHWSHREPWKWAESQTQNTDIGQSPAQRPQTYNVYVNSPIFHSEF